MCSPPFCVFGVVGVAHLFSFLCCVFGVVGVAHHFSFLCCVFGGVRVAHHFSFLCCVFGGVRVAHHFSFLCCVGFFFYLSLFCFFFVCVQEKFEDTKRVTRIRISKKDRHHNDQKEKG